MVMYALEQRWEVSLRLTYKRCRFWLKKKIIFSDDAHFDLGGYVNKQNCRIWGTENSQAYIEKPTHPKRVTVWSRGINKPFFFEWRRNVEWREMWNENIEEGDIGNIWFGFNRMALRATQPKLHSLFCALF